MKKCTQCLNEAETNEWTVCAVCVAKAKEMNGTRPVIKRKLSPGKTT